MNATIPENGFPHICARKVAGDAPIAIDFPRERKIIQRLNEPREFQLFGLRRLRCKDRHLVRL